MKKNFFLKSIIVIILLFINSIIGYSQSTWYRTWGIFGNNETGKRVVQTFDGGYAVLTQVSKFNVSGTHYNLLKYDNAGNFLWSNLIADSIYKTLWDMQQTKDSGFIFAGWCTYVYGALLIKTDKYGNLKWQKHYPNLNFNTQFFAVKQTLDSGYIACGSYLDYVNPSNKGIVIKVDSLGYVQWEKQYLDSLFNGFGDIFQASDKKYYITSATFNIDTSIYAVFKKIDSAGNVIWNNFYCHNNGSCQNITQLKDGSLILSGPDENFQPLIAKFDTLGNTKWVKNYTSPPFYYYYMCKDIFDNIVITGGRDFANTSTISNWKLDTGGTILKVKNVSSSNYYSVGSYCIKPTYDTGFVIVGDAALKDSFTNPRPDCLIIKTDSAFNSPIITKIVNISNTFANEFKVYQNYPNPFNPKTVLKFHLPNNGYVEISIYDVLGKKVFSNKEYCMSGLNERCLDFGWLNLSSGVYFIKIHPDKSEFKLLKVIYLK
ncbi:MAG: T9SS type A sorting domain-containing protein [Ignavibacteria bacterium]|jgi:hypothetical protein